MWTKQTHRIYAKAYHQAVRDGHDIAIARGMARAAARDATGAAPITAGEGPSRGYEHSTKASPTQLAERDRFRLLEHPTPTAAFFGDPLPGRSALDLMTAEDRARFL